MAALATARRRAASPARQQQGNDAAQRRAMRPQLGMPAYMQRKMRRGEPGDAYEVEADRVADHVTSGGVSSAEPGVQRAPAEEKKQDSKPGAAAAGGKAEQKGAAAGGAKDQKPAAGGKDQKPKDAKPGSKDAKPAAPGAKPGQAPEKKDQVARKEVSAEDKVDKAKQEHAKKEEQKAKLEGDKEGDVQRKAARPMISRLVDTAVRRDARGGAGTVASDAESRIDATRGRGKPLPEETRSTMESGFGEDFSSVRIHDDADADGLSRDLDAHAFTVGSDIYFAQGAYAPESAEGRHLLAHELTHVVQQGGSEGVQRMATAQRAKNKGSAKPAAGGGTTSPDEYDGPEGKIHKDFAQKDKKTELKGVQLPKVKAGFGSPPFTLNTNRRSKKVDKDTGAVIDAGTPTRQGTLWRELTPKEGLVTQLDAQLAKHKGKSSGIESMKLGKKVYFARHSKLKRNIVGTPGAVADQLRNPSWNINGKSMNFQIDHKEEIQLGGIKNDRKDNLWLLESRVNQQSGENLNDEIFKRINLLIAKASLWGDNPPSYDQVRYGPTVEVKEPKYSLPPSGGPHLCWEATDINDGKQMRDLVPMTEKEIKESGYDKDMEVEFVVLHTQEGGGRALVLPVKKVPTTVSLSANLLPGLKEATVTLTETGGTIRGAIQFAGADGVLRNIPPVTLQLKKEKDAPADEKSYFIDLSSKPETSGITIPGWSPVTLTDIDFTPAGVVAMGVIDVEVPILKKGTQIEFSIGGEEGFAVWTTLNAGEFTFPGPVKITGGMLTLKGSKKGLGATGQINFEVKGLGTGYLRAEGSQSGCVLSGHFEGKSKTFSRFDIDLAYGSEKGLTGGGSIEVAKGKIPGVKKAGAKVTVEGANWSADGTVEPEVKILKSVKIGAAYTEGAGFTFTGKAEIGDAPCVSGGDVSVTLAQAGEGWEVSANGTLNLSAPGLDAATAKVAYDKGVFTAEVTVGFKKGRLAGSVTIGVTNQPRALPVPADAAAAAGAPAAPPKAAPDQITFYGAGAVTIQVTPWLKGTVGMAFLPNGDVIVTGKVELGEIELVPEKTFDKEIFSMHVDIPIVGVSFLGQRIGIFATVGGNVKFTSGFGPVKLRNTELDIAYSPQHEDQTAVHGHAQVWCPAHAGLRIAINGGVGVGIPVVSATVGLELGGMVSIKGEATLDVDVDWGANKPFTFTTVGKLEVMPTIKIDLSAFAKIEADVVFSTITLYEDRWQLAGYEWGSDAAFRVEFPITYTEGKGLDLSLDNITVTAPPIDPIAMVEKMIG